MSNSDKKGSATELKNLKEAIIDLYLAIKIRSTDEVSSVHKIYLKSKKMMRTWKLNINVVVRSDRWRSFRKRKKKVVKAGWISDSWIHSFIDWDHNEFKDRGLRKRNEYEKINGFWPRYEFFWIFHNFI